eukprot:1729482-Prymnesium_polylepis.1
MFGDRKVQPMAAAVLPEQCRGVDVTRHGAAAAAKAVRQHILRGRDRHLVKHSVSEVQSAQLHKIGEQAAWHVIEIRPPCAQSAPERCPVLPQLGKVENCPQPLPLCVEAPLVRFVGLEEIPIQAVRLIEEPTDLKPGR